MLFMCFSLIVSAQSDTVPQLHSSESKESVGVIDLRIPAKEKIEEYKKDDRFQYEQPNMDLSFFQKMKYWLLTLFDKLFSGTVQSGVPAFIVVLIIIAVVILIVLKLMGVKFKTLLGKKKMDTPEIDFYTENVHEMNFDTLIARALKNKDYRLAVRFLYLKNLKLLSDKALIKWDINKTNYSYQYEINNATVRSKFLEATFIFDYVWYGEFPLDETQFSEIRTRMVQFNEVVGNER